jgi:hypothetical protein
MKMGDDEDLIEVTVTFQVPASTAHFLHDPPHHPPHHPHKGRCEWNYFHGVQPEEIDEIANETVNFLTCVSLFQAVWVSHFQKLLADRKIGLKQAH